MSTFCKPHAHSFRMNQNDHVRAVNDRPANGVAGPTPTVRSESVRLSSLIPPGPVRSASGGKARPTIPTVPPVRNSSVLRSK